jgi:hypothetical protein
LRAETRSAGTMLTFPTVSTSYVPCGIESKIIQLLVQEDPHSYRKASVVLMNEKGELNATGKTATAAYVCSRDKITSYFSDGILYFPLGPLWKVTPSSLESFFGVLLKEISELLCPKLMILELKTNQTQSKQTWENKIHDIMSLAGASSQILVVLDGLEDLNLISYLAHLGLGLLVTTRSDEMSDGTSVSISRYLPSGESKFRGDDGLSLQVDSIVTLDTLLTGDPSFC